MVPIDWVLLAMLFVSPAHYSETHASAISMAATTKLEAAVLVATAYEEGRYCTACARGDGGRARSTYQIHPTSEAQGALLDRDPWYAARLAVWLVRLSARVCPDSPLAPYAGGCRSQAARNISARRMRLAEAIVEVLDSE